MKKPKTVMVKLVEGLARVRKSEGSMQVLATQEVYYLRRIVALLQFKLRNVTDSYNRAQRKARRLSKLVDLHRSLAVEYSDEIKRLAAIIKAFESAEKLVPSNVKGLDL